MASPQPATIAVDRLGKRYRLGQGMPAFRTLGEALTDRILRRKHHGAHGRSSIWALRDVSFEIEQGEAIGVIGANGAGKTTLLKILSRITEPTAGRATVRGRVGSLLEVGTGFHPELTGRENIFLNGAILGMRRKEIERKLEEIVEFSGVSEFLDTPVKRYSSGMYVRLAFSVAAHLETEILLVDEVLSVGDFGFQRRCLGKMQEQTSAEGRTVLFVSHNLAAVKMLTERCLWLEKGELRDFGPTEDVFQQYVLSYENGAGYGYTDLSDLAEGRPHKADPLRHEVTFEWVKLQSPAGVITSTHLTGDPIIFRLGLRARRRLRNARLEIRCRVYTLEGLLVFGASSGAREIDWEKGLYETVFTVDPNPLGAGTYVIELLAFTVSDRSAGLGQDLLRSAATFHVVENPRADGNEGYAPQEKRALIRVDAAWDEFVAAEKPLSAGRPL